MNVGNSIFFFNFYNKSSIVRPNNFLNLKTNSHRRNVDLTAPILNLPPCICHMTGTCYWSVDSPKPSSHRVADLSGPWPSWTVSFSPLLSIFI